MRGNYPIFYLCPSGNQPNLTIYSIQGKSTLISSLPHNCLYLILTGCASFVSPISNSTILIVLLAFGFPARGYRIESVVDAFTDGVEIGVDLDIKICSTLDSDVSKYNILSVRLFVLVIGGDQI